MPISSSGGHQPEGWWVILSGGGAFSNGQALGTTGDMPAGGESAGWETYPSKEYIWMNGGIVAFEH